VVVEMLLLSWVNKNWKVVLFVLSLIAIALLAFWWLKISTPYGLGMINDSSAYVGGAVNMLGGYGYSRLSGGGEVKPITHFPPMFSIILALVGLTGINIISAARLVVLLLYSFNVVLVAISLLVITRRNLISLLGAFLFATNSVFLSVHSMLMSEPLFITFCLLSGLFLAYFFNEKHRRWLFFAGLFAGFAALTRYAGLALFLTAILTIVLLRHKLKNVLVDVIFFLLGAVPLTLAWSLRNRFLTGTAANRQILWHPPAWSKIEFGLFNFLDWLFPDRIFIVLKEQKWAAYGLAFLLVLAFMIMIVYTWYRLIHDEQVEKYVETGKALLLFHQMHVIVYIGSILATMILVDASTLFENRILAPMEVSFLIVILALISRWMGRSVYLLRFVVALVILVFAWYWVSDGSLTVDKLRRDGGGFASLAWRNSRTIEYIQRLPPEKIIYTNKSTAVFLLTGRNAYAVQSRVDPVTQIPRASYVEELDRLHNDVLSRRAVLIFFGADQQTAPEDRAWLEDLRSGLTIFEDFGDSEVYDR
jgi:hypothetical protein